jgi:hypothetical protein
MKKRYEKTNTGVVKAKGAGLSRMILVGNL